MDEIEYNWNDSVRTRKDYYLIRTFIHKPKGINKVALQIYDTDENALTIDQVDSDKKVVSILEIIGLKFSSNSFHLEICLRQLMVINEKPIFNKCLIKLNSKKSSGENNLTEKTENKMEIVSDNTDLKNEEDKVEDIVSTTITNNLVDNLENTTDEVNDEVNDLDDGDDINNDKEDLTEQEETTEEKNVKFSVEDKEHREPRKDQ